MRNEMRKKRERKGIVFEKTIMGSMGDRSVYSPKSVETLSLCYLTMITI